MSKDYGVYIHIPFCKQKCFYCDFPSFAGREKYINEYLHSLRREMELGAERFGIHGKLMPNTVYIGGGTPSHLNFSQMEMLFEGIHANMQAYGTAEFTMEANPCTLDEEKLHLMKNNGVNRISIGVQSFDDGCLKCIGRVHTGDMALEKVKLAQSSGFQNISIDLMYGLPGQTLDTLKMSLDKAMELDVQHISIYGLQLEEGTVLAKQQEMKRLELPDDEAVEEMYDYLVDFLPTKGFNRYEISNYAQEGYHSRHNTLYWQDIPYLGFGSGAHSYWQGNRYENPVDLGEYIKAIAEGKFLNIMEEFVSEKAHMEEFCFLGLRMTKGMDKKKFRQTFDKDIHEIFGGAIDKMVARELLEESGSAIFLTPLGMKYANVVFGEFILE